MRIDKTKSSRRPYAELREEYEAKAKSLGLYPEDFCRAFKFERQWFRIIGLNMKRLEPSGAVVLAESSDTGVRYTFTPASVLSGLCYPR